MTYFLWLDYLVSMYNSMAKGNLYKIKKANDHHSIQGSTLEDHYPQELKSPLSDQN